MLPLTHNLSKFQISSLTLKVEQLKVKETEAHVIQCIKNFPHTSKKLPKEIQSRNIPFHNFICLLFFCRFSVEHSSYKLRLQWLMVKSQQVVVSKCITMKNARVHNKNLPFRKNKSIQVSNPIQPTKRTTYEGYLEVDF